MLRWGPNATYIPLEMGMKSTQKTRNVHGQRKKFVSPNVRDTNMLVFFALGNAKLPDASSFASQWNINIGLKLFGNLVGYSPQREGLHVTDTNTLVPKRPHGTNENLCTPNENHCAPNVTPNMS